MPTWGHFPPCWRPSSAKFGPKRVLKACQHQKRDFSPNTRPRVRERKFQSQDGLQNVPRSAQDGRTRTHVPCVCARAPVRLRFRVCASAFFGDQKIDQKFDCSKCRPKIATRPPKTSPGPPQERPKTPQDHPKTTQELPKRPPRPPKMPSRAPKIASRLPKMLPRDPKVAPRYRDISFGWLRLHNARIRTNNERMMNE